MPRDEIEVFLDGQILVKAEPLGHVADVLLDLGASRAEIEAEAGAAAVVGREQAAEHAQEGRLAAAVRAEKAANLAGPHLHGDVVDDRAVAEFFRHAANVNGEVGTHRVMKH